MCGGQEIRTDQGMEGQNLLPYPEVAVYKPPVLLCIFFSGFCIFRSRHVSNLFQCLPMGFPNLEGFLNDNYKRSVAGHIFFFRMDLLSPISRGRPA